MGGIESEFSVKRVPLLKFGQNLRLMDPSTLENRLNSNQLCSDNYDEIVTEAELQELKDMIGPSASKLSKEKLLENAHKQALLQQNS